MPTCTWPAPCLERLSTNAAGQIVYQLKNPYRDGTTHILFDPEDFIARLARRHDAQRPIQPIPICWPNANKSEATVPAARTISRLPVSPLHPYDNRYNRRAISEPSR
jgi:hypothetical protein